VLRLLIDYKHLSKNWVVFGVLGFYGWCIGSVNRFLTVYITFTRARIVWSLAQANRRLHKTERDHIRETIVCGLTPGVVWGVATAMCMLVFSKIQTDQSNIIQQISLKIEIQAYHNFVLFGFFAIVCCNMVVVSLATYIFWKTYHLRLDDDSHVMQKNVAAVAFVFCVCHVPMPIRWGELAFQSEAAMNAWNNSTMPIEISNLFLVVSNGANIIIYTAFGKNFRTKLFDVLFSCRQRRGQGSEKDGR
jgi:hypothetical protein